MPVTIAYLAVLLIWSTTPLGIIWSSESISPSLAVLLRMIIALILGGIIIKVRHINIPWHRKAYKLYSYSALGIFGGMMCSYLAASYLSSGIMSLVFGLSPILSAILAQKILREAKLSIIKQLAMVIAFIGLAIVCSDNINIENSRYIGYIYILFAVFFFSLSGVLVKSVSLAIHPLATTVGSLSFSLPLFLISWFILDGSLSIDEWQSKSVWSTLYLGVFGSLIGFYAYFYVLQKLTASTVTLITLVTPVIAITLGTLFNDEVLNSTLLYGASIILLGLTLYHWGDNIVKRMKKRRQFA
ncbi:DMT family transporter [Litorilituus lipolyticus]|uniref:DMT family transporter n=1 Tax=Litorilituus lipolyticus TaxID=2491017 RepID=A0A502KR68_9GAMM|nr:DMT family transporter [Litorilituus lipolyticus]TPH12809.1 DMT family transporter [Litorilituus lipolyticus]